MESCAEESGDGFEFTANGLEDAGAVRFAHGVDDDDEALVPPGSVIGAGGVGVMVRDVKDAIGGKIGQVALDEFDEGFVGKDTLEEFLGDRIERVDVAVGFVIEAVNDGIDVVELQAGFLQAPGNCARGEMGTLLFAVEAFLGGGRPQFCRSRLARRRRRGPGKCGSRARRGWPSAGA